MSEAVRQHPDFIPALERATEIWGDARIISTSSPDRQAWTGNLELLETTTVNETDLHLSQLESETEIAGGIAGAVAFGGLTSVLLATFEEKNAPFADMLHTKPVVGGAVVALGFLTLVLRSKK
jgi:hypothetical protein